MPLSRPGGNILNARHGGSGEVDFHELVVEPPRRMLWRPETGSQAASGDRQRVNSVRASTLTSFYPEKVDQMRPCAATPGGIKR